MRDALRAAQGCSGSFCAFRAGGAEGPADGAALVVRGGGTGGDAGVSWPQRNALHLVGELGVMFR